MKLTKRLIAMFIIACLLPLIIICVISAVSLNARSTELVNQNIALVSQVQSNNIKYFFQQREVNLRILEKYKTLRDFVNESNNSYIVSENAKGSALTISELFTSRIEEQNFLKCMYLVDDSDEIIACSDLKKINDKYVGSYNMRKATPGKSYISEITKSGEFAKNDSQIAINFPIYIDDVYQGFVGEVIDLSYFENMKNNTALYESGYVLLIDGYGTIVTSGSSLKYSSIEELLASNDCDFGEKYKNVDFKTNKTGSFMYNLSSTKRCAYYSVIGDTQWVMFSSVAWDDVTMPTKKLLFISVSISIIVASIIVALAIFIIKKSSSPLKNLLDTISKQHMGDSSVRFTYEGNDEFGQIANAFNKLMDKETLNMQKLQDTNFELKTTIENIPGGVYRCSCDDDMRFLFVSQGFLKLVDCTREELEKKYENKAINLVYHKDRKYVLDEHKRQLAVKDTVDAEYRIRCNDGSLIWVLDKSKVVLDNNGKKWIYCVIVDITVSRAIQDELRQSREQYRAILEQSEDIICEWNFSENSLICSEYWLKKFGYYLPTTEFYEFLIAAEKVHPDDVDDFRKWINEIHNGSDCEFVEFRVINIKGNYVWLKVKSKIIRDDEGAPVKAVGVIADITKDKITMEKLVIEAKTDLLTKLYNKMTTEHLIREYLNDTTNEYNHEGENPKENALMIIDIDNFKEINDNFGHMLGDAVLTDIAAKLKTIFREPDILGRIGGDEFIIFIKGVSAIKTLESKAQRISEKFRQTFADKDKLYQISASIGIAVSPKDGMTFEELYRNADSALYFAKKQGKDRHAFFNNDMQGTSYVKKFQR